MAGMWGRGAAGQQPGSRDTPVAGPCPELAGISVASDAGRGISQLVGDFVAQERGAQDEGGPDQREHKNIFDRGNAALVVPELCQKLSSFAHNASPLD